MIPNNTRNSDGFTLIELMVTVVIIGILAAIAYPSYTKYVSQSRRSDAYTALSQIANNLEKFYSQCSCYTTDITSASQVSCQTPALVLPACSGTLGLGLSGNTSPSQYYTLSITTSSAGGAPLAGYLITATAQGVQVSDTDCRTFTLDSTGAKKSKNSSSVDTSTICWKK
jgi:type IV pilus assembly protein PilE